MDLMDPNRYCTKRLFREHCQFVNGIFVKDMSQLGRSMKNIAIIDNSPNSYMLQPECGIPIISWYDDLKDRALYNYIPFLIELSKVPDMREAINGFVRNNMLESSVALQVCQKILEAESRKARKMKELEAERMRRENAPSPGPEHKREPSQSPHKSPLKSQACSPFISSDSPIRGTMMRNNVGD